MNIDAIDLTRLTLEMLSSQRNVYLKLAGTTETAPFDLLSKTHWKALESTLLTVSPQKDTPGRTNWSSKEETVNNLRALGIPLGLQPTVVELNNAVTLVQALIRHAHVFKSEDQVIPAHLIDGQYTFPPYVWEEIGVTWGQFFGAPWHGLTMEPPPGMDITKCFWCNSELFRVLREWGDQFMRRLIDGGLSPELALQKSIKLRYTGKPFGGMVDDRIDFSQIGYCAAISLTDIDANLLVTLCGALMEVDPGYRIRLYNQGLKAQFKDPNDPAINSELADIPVNLSFSPVPIRTAVVEPDPVLERVLRRPATLRKALSEMPTLFDRISMEQLAATLAHNGGHLSTDEFREMFSAIREAGGGPLFLTLLEHLRARGGISLLVERADLEEADIINTVMNVDMGLIISDDDRKKINARLIYLFKKWKEYSNLSVELNKIDYKKAVAELIQSNLVN